MVLVAFMFCLWLGDCNILLYVATKAIASLGLLVQQAACDLPRLMVGLTILFQRRMFDEGAISQSCRIDTWNVDKTDLSTQKGSNGHLIGGIQDGSGIVSATQAFKRQF